MRSPSLPKVLICLEWMGLGKNMDSQVDVSRFYQVLLLIFFVAFTVPFVSQLKFRFKLISLGWNILSYTVSVDTVFAGL